MSQTFYNGATQVFDETFAKPAIPKPKTFQEMTFFPKSQLETTSIQVGLNEVNEAPTQMEPLQAENEVVSIETFNVNSEYADNEGDEHHIDIHEAPTQIDELIETSVQRTSIHDLPTQVRPVEAKNVIEVPGIEIHEAVTQIDELKESSIHRADIYDLPTQVQPLAAENEKERSHVNIHEMDTQIDEVKEYPLNNDCPTQIQLLEAHNVKGDEIEQVWN